MASAPCRMTGFSWLLLAAVVLHAAISPAANWAVVAAFQSEEESEQREIPAEEELAGIFGATPARGYGISRARGLLLSAWRSERDRRLAATYLRWQSPPDELAGRNGCGVPLRC
jgi:hypothetical protein